MKDDIVMVDGNPYRVVMAHGKPDLRRIIKDEERKSISVYIRPNLRKLIAEETNNGNKNISRMLDAMAERILHERKEEK